MSKKYKFADNDKIYFVSFAVTNWIDLFIRNEYRNEILDSIRFCQANKEMVGLGFLTIYYADFPYTEVPGMKGLMNQV